MREMLKQLGFSEQNSVSENQGTRPRLNWDSKQLDFAHLSFG